MDNLTNTGLSPTSDKIINELVISTCNKLLAVLNIFKLDDNL